MAGVKCPHCGELMVGALKKNEVISCISCEKAFQVTKELMAAYELEKEQKPWDYIRNYGIISVGVLLAVSIALFALFGEKTPVQKTRSEQVQELFFADGQNYEVVQAVKKSMNDPDSFEHVETKYVDQGSGDVQVFMTFRGKNALGAKIINRAVASIDPVTLKVTNLVIEH